MRLRGSEFEPTLGYVFLFIILEIVKQRVGQKKKDPYSKKVAEENFQCCSKFQPETFLFHSRLQTKKNSQRTGIAAKKKWK